MTSHPCSPAQSLLAELEENILPVWHRLLHAEGAEGTEGEGSQRPLLKEGRGSDLGTWEAALLRVHARR